MWALRFTLCELESVLYFIWLRRRVRDSRTEPWSVALVRSVPCRRFQVPASGHGRVRAATHKNLIQRHSAIFISWNP